MMEEPVVYSGGRARKLNSALLNSSMSLAKRPAMSMAGARVLKKMFSKLPRLWAQ